MITIKYTIAPREQEGVVPFGLKYVKQILDESDLVVDSTEISPDMYVEGSEAGASTALKNLMIQVFNPQFEALYEQAMVEQDELDPLIRLSILLDEYKAAYLVHYKLKKAGK